MASGLSITEVYGSRIASTAAVYLNKKPIDQIFSGNLLLGTLLGQQSRANKMTFPLRSGRVKRQTGGREVRIRLRYNRSTNVTSFTHLDELSTNLDDLSTICKAKWAYYTDFAGQSWQEGIENEGEGLNYSLIEERLDASLDTLKERIDTDLLGTGDGVSVGNGGKNVIGLNHLIPADPTTGTCWGLNRSIYDFWQPGLVTAGGAFSSVGVAKLAYAYVYGSGTMGEDPPTLYLTTRDQFLAYHAIIAALQEITTLSTTKGGERSGDAAFETLYFMRRPVLYHAGQTSNVWMQLNLNYFVVFLQNRAQFAVLPFKGDAKTLMDVLNRIVIGLQVGCERMNRQYRILFTG